MFISTAPTPGRPAHQFWGHFHLFALHCLICTRFAVDQVQPWKNYYLQKWVSRSTSSKYHYCYPLIFSSPSYYVLGNLVILQIFDFRFLADLHVLESGNPKYRNFAYRNRNHMNSSWQNQLFYYCVPFLTPCCMVYKLIWSKQSFQRHKHTSRKLFFIVLIRLL